MVVLLQILQLGTNNGQQLETEKTHVLQIPPLTKVPFTHEIQTVAEEQVSHETRVELHNMHPLELDV